VPIGSCPPRCGFEVTRRVPRGKSEANGSAATRRPHGIDPGATHSNAIVLTRA
jgi:hypothetical protein